MILIDAIPAAPLSAFVDRFWYCENPNPGHRVERVMPDGRTALVINLVDDRLSTLYGDDLSKRRSVRGIAVAGAYSHHVGLDTSEQGCIMGVHFKPGGLRPLLAPSADQLADRDLSLDTLWGAAAAELHEQLIEAPTPADKFALLARALLQRAPHPIERNPLVAEALQRFETAPQAVQIGRLVKEAGISPKRFIRVFRAEVGLTPKRYCRIRRFRRVLAAIERKQSIEWAGLAADCGYYDQAHFIRDFREFSGWNPSAFLAVRGDRINHIPLPD